MKAKTIDPPRFSTWSFGLEHSTLEIKSGVDATVKFSVLNFNTGLVLLRQEVEMDFKLGIL